MFFMFPHNSNSSTALPTFNYTTLRCTALQCTALQWTAFYSTALRFSTLHCTALQCTALYSTALRCTALHWTVQYCTSLHDSVLHCFTQPCPALLPLPDHSEITQSWAAAPPSSSLFPQHGLARVEESHKYGHSVTLALTVSAKCRKVKWSEVQCNEVYWNRNIYKTLFCLFL